MKKKKQKKKTKKKNCSLSRQVLNMKHWNRYECDKQQHRQHWPTAVIAAATAIVALLSSSSSTATAPGYTFMGKIFVTKTFDANTPILYIVYVYAYT